MKCIFFSGIYSFLIVCFFLNASVSRAQISPSASVKFIETEYAGAVEQDLIVYFKDLSISSLTSAPTEDDVVSYQWRKHTGGAWSNWVDIAGETDMTINSLSVNGIGGYQIGLFDVNGIEVETQQCWVYDYQEPEMTLSVEDASCSEITLLASIQGFVEHTYYEPGEDTPILTRVLYNWGTPQGMSEAVGLGGAKQTLEGPYEDTKYSVELYWPDETPVLRANGGVVEGSLSFEAFAIDADFKIEKDNSNPYGNESYDIENEVDRTFSGDKELTFTSDSKGLGNYFWEVTYKDGEPDVFKDREFLSYRFSQSGSYSVTLRMEGIIPNEEYAPDGCTSSKTETISIVESMLGVPNVFTPDGDGRNDRFMVAHASLEDFSIYIYNRWGRKVYHSNDPNDGWNGKIGGRYASPGVYFYVIKAKGVEGEVWDREGSVHLLRGK